MLKSKFENNQKKISLLKTALSVKKGNQKSYKKKYGNKTKKQTKRQRNAGA